MSNNKDTDPKSHAAIGHYPYTAKRNKDSGATISNMRSCKRCSYLATAKNILLW